MRLLRFRRRRRGGRPRIDAETRDLINRMAQDNVLWGAPRIHGELLTLGFNVSQATVSRYLRRCVRPRSPGWRSFFRAQRFSNGLPQAIDGGEAITEWREARPGSAPATGVRPAQWMGDRWVTERSVRGSAGRRPPGSGRINVQIHSLIECRPLHVQTNVMIVLPLGRSGCSQPRAPPPCRTGGSDQVLRRDRNCGAQQRPHDRPNSPAANRQSARLGAHCRFHRGWEATQPLANVSLLLGIYAARLLISNRKQGAA
jgi:hypothetical protein